MLCMSSCDVSVSVCLSVRFVNSVKTNKHILKKFSPTSSQAILVFPYQTAWQYSPGPNGGVECRCGRQKLRFWTYIWLHCVLSIHCANDQLLSTRRCRTTVPQVVTLIAGSNRRSLLMARNDDEMFMTRSLNVTPKTTEQHLIVRSDKSVAYVTNNKRLYSTFCSIEANYWQTWSIARSLCDSRATCWLLQIPLLSVPCLSVRCLADVCKHDFCKKALSDFSETLSVYCCRGLVVRNEKLFRPKI